MKVYGELPPTRLVAERTAMKINCIRHGEVEAEPNKNGDVRCPTCWTDIINSFQVPKDFLGPSPYVGIDMGYSEGTAMVLYDKDGKVIESKFISAKDARPPGPASFAREYLGNWPPEPEPEPPRERPWAIKHFNEPNYSVGCVEPPPCPHTSWTATRGVPCPDCMAAHEAWEKGLAELDLVPKAMAKKDKRT